MFGRGEKLIKTRFIDEEEEKRIIEFYVEQGFPENFARILVHILKFRPYDEDENEESDDVVYEYIDLVYPPNSKPPTLKSIKKKNLIDFNLIFNMIC